MLNLFSLLFLFISSFTYAQELEGPTEPNKIDRWHYDISHRYINFARDIDQFIARSDEHNEENNSLISFSWITSKQEYSNISSRAYWKLHMEFPETKKQLQVSFERQSKDDILVEKQEPVPASQDETIKAGVRQDFQLARYWKFRVGGGVRVKLPPYPFFKMGAQLKLPFQLLEWINEVTLYWDSEQQLIQETMIYFDRKISENLSFRWIDSLSWQDRGDEFTFAIGPDLYQTISDRSKLRYTLRATADSRPKWILDQYDASVIYRRYLYKQWFFYELIPSVIFPRENDWHAIGQIQIKFELLFGNY